MPVPAGSLQWPLAPRSSRLRSVVAWCRLSRGVWGLCPAKGTGLGGGDAFAWLAALAQGSSQPWDRPEFPMLAPQNQAGLGKGLVPHCLSIFACHLGIKFQANLKEKIAVRVGWVGLQMGYVQEPWLGNARVKLVMGCLATSLQCRGRWQCLPPATLHTLFGNGTEMLLCPFPLQPIASPALGGNIWSKASAAEVGVELPPEQQPSHLHAVAQAGRERSVQTPLPAPGGAPPPVGTQSRPLLPPQLLPPAPWGVQPSPCRAPPPQPSGTRQGEHARPHPFGLSFSVSPFIYSSFHVSVFSLLHAMAVVLHADETVRGTTAGSHFSGNF